MQRALLISWLLLLTTAAVHAQQDKTPKIHGVALTPALVDAYQDLAIAKQRLIHYRQVIQPRRQQFLEDATRQKTAEILMLQRRLLDHQPFLAVGDYSAIRQDAEYDWLSLKAAEQHLMQLRQEELHEVQFRGENDNLYVYEVLRAALRVRAAHATSGK